MGGACTGKEGLVHGLLLLWARLRRWGGKIAAGGEDLACGLGCVREHGNMESCPGVGAHS